MKEFYGLFWIITSLLTLYYWKKHTNNISATIYKFSYDRSSQIKYPIGHSPGIMNDIFKLRENMYNLRNFYIFQTENPSSLKYGLDAIPYRASQLWQQVSIDILEVASLALFENWIKTWKCEDCPCRSCKIFFENVEYIWIGPSVIDVNMSVNWSIYVWGIYG